MTDDRPSAAELLDDPYIGWVCTVIIRNEIPSSWQVTIVSAVVTFVYRDGTRSMSTAANVNLGYHEEATVQSQDKCVSTHTVSLRVQDPKGTHLLEKAYPPVPNQCTLSGECVLAPTKTISEGDFKSKPGRIGMVSIA
jgi:hypothetical protein